MDREETFGLSILMWKTTMMVKIVEPWKLIFPTVIKRQFFFLIFIVVHFAKKFLYFFYSNSQDPDRYLSDGSWENIKPNTTRSHPQDSAPK